VASRHRGLKFSGSSKPCTRAAPSWCDNAIPSPRCGPGGGRGFRDRASDVLPPSERNGQTVDHIVEAARRSRSWLGRLEPFGKDPPLASRSVAEEAAGPQNQRYSHACGRRSANRLRYWLCTRLQTPPHIGHRQTLAETLIPITKPPSSLVALSTTNPRGTSSATVKPPHSSDPQPESEPNRRFDFVKSESDPILDAKWSRLEAI
jgi:hypothetical protein